MLKYEQLFKIDDDCSSADCPCHRFVGLVYSKQWLRRHPLWMLASGYSFSLLFLAYLVHIKGSWNFERLIRFTILIPVLQVGQPVSTGFKWQPVQVKSQLHRKLSRFVFEDLYLHTRMGSLQGLCGKANSFSGEKQGLLHHVTSLSDSVYTF